MFNKILTISNNTHVGGTPKSISISGDPQKVVIFPNQSIIFDLIKVQFDERFIDSLYDLSEAGTAKTYLDGVLLSSTEIGNLKYGGGWGSDSLVKVGAAGTPDYLSSTYFEQDAVNHIRPIQRIDDTSTALNRIWSSTKIDTELSGKADIQELRVVFKERFVGTGAQTLFTLTNAITNATFSTGSWNVSRVLTTLPAHATKTTGKVLYDSANLFSRNRIEVSSINGSGVATLSHPPILGESFDLWYWYEIQSTDVIDDYYREDFIATMEAASDKIASQVPTNTSNFNNILGVGDTTVQISLDTLDDHTHDHSTLTNLGTGSDHSYINQDVKDTASPTFVALNSINNIDFDITTAVAAAEGRLTWNINDGTLNLGMPGGNVNLQIGQEGLIRVRNISGSKILNGRLVYPTGSSGNRLTIDLADCSDADKFWMLGMTTEDIDHNANGYVALWGRVSGDTLQPINTSGYPEGTKLYLSSSGTFTNVHPTDPTHCTIIVGLVQRQHASLGEINLQFNYFTIGNNFDGTLRQSIINKSTGVSAATGFTAVNDQGHRTTVGIGGSNNAAFGEACVFYGEGYNDNLYAVDGNKSHKWFVDPTDSHNNSSLSYLSMELDPSGNLTIPRGQITSTIATGTSPLNVTSTTLNTNLNADLLDGQHGAYYLSTADWDQNGFLNRTDSTITFTDLTRTFSIQPTVTNFDYWIAGVKYTSTGDTVVIDNTDGAHVIYFDGSTLTALANPTDAQMDVIIRTKAFVSFIIWNVSAVEGIYVGEERHGKVLSPSSHSYHHFVDGLRYGYGLGLNTLSVDGTGVTVDAQFGVDAGSVFDEDIFASISTVVSTTGLPIYYMTGAGAVWNRSVVAGFSARTLDNTSATLLAYNQFTGGAWQLTQVPSNNFVLYHVFATTEKDTPMISVMGQDSYGNITAARQAALTEIQSLVLDDALFPEMRPIATIIYQTNLTYTNAINARIRSTDTGDDYIDWRSETISRVSLSTSDHGSLTGLGIDDHLQYVLVDGTRSMTGSLLAPTFDTNVAAAGLTLSGTTLAADGTDANIDITITPKGNAGIVLPNAGSAPAATANKLFQTSSLLNFHNIVLAGSSTNQTGTLILDDGVNWRVTLVFSNGALSSVTTAASSAALASWT
jgi:hypothetical protein